MNSLIRSSLVATCALIGALAGAQAPTVLEEKVIGSGSNHPAINLSTEGLNKLCVMLHRRIRLDEIRSLTGWSVEDLQKRLDKLAADGLVKKAPSGAYLPTAMVITLEDAKKYLLADPVLVTRAANLIEAKAPEIRRRCASINGLRQSAGDTSLLVFSDVLMDDGQLAAIEDRVVGEERTDRAGKHYYCSILEKPRASLTEAFGIYDSMTAGFGLVSVSVYGNRRNGKNFLTLATDDLRSMFAMPQDADPSVFRQTVLEEWTQGGVPAAHSTGFEKLGWTLKGKATVPVLTSAEFEDFNGLADVIRDEFAGMLKDNRPMLEQQYKQSPYAEEVSFGEWFMWWYHLYYTAVTDELVKRRLVTVPASGVVSYLVKG